MLHEKLIYPSETPICIGQQITMLLLTQSTIKCFIENFNKKYFSLLILIISNPL